MRLKTGISVAVACAAVMGVSIAAIVRAAEQPSASAEVPTVDDLAFLAGHWSGDAFGGHGEEAWMAPSGGTMIGGFRLVSKGKTGVTEFLMITQEESGPVYRFKHFRTDYTPWEKDAPLIFNLTTIESNHAVFTSPDPEQHPNRLEYRRNGDELRIRVGEGEGSFELTFQRSK